ncbi:group II intron reverse transcriptase/maturase [Clostridium sp. FP1]|uniref:group II intron reverse transcriptase/maturase n=1 Tax=Clostridium sp. FP1 TaxID=2724076 RepID=UPI001CCCFEE2|nr:group II intron reverse transcriptase/maturase [Clostridium sp. FP1]MBZ9633659.1 group II intron reverse transcriptase/maturase [Clostridium sp. FP1]MBZ9633736.1 group II intron reverse transcriptase/maturase [Clostridium sp. FP1]MBZ9636605.1 group II intron reverse transcriptase/maturase [Clostridium sp. FP1]MBZ9636609.1 group II intron reverse transcriptase/maturase [Clostridium sp. FP1]
MCILLIKQTANLDEKQASFYWKSIDWKNIEKFVNKIQARIVKATINKNWKLVKELQRMLVHSHYAKLMSVKRITTNKGKKTPGIDNILWNSAKKKCEAVKLLNSKNYKPKPLKRVNIRKQNGKLRPLGIATMHDRAMQTLYMMGLDPVVESMSDKTSFGFRKNRSCVDAMSQIFINFSRKSSPTWVLEGDIKGCFNNISHKWLTDNSPMDTNVLNKLIKSGYVYKGKLFSTKSGTAQGSPISPCLANFTLDGIDELLKSTFKRSTKIRNNERPKVNLIRYADDFIVTAPDSETAIKAKEIIKSFLIQRGLELSDEKTIITHIDEGFDFIGWNIKKYKGKLLIKPSQKSIKRVISKISAIIKGNKSVEQDILIIKLNQIITGWSNYHQCAVSNDIFQKIDHITFQMLWKWAKRRHPNKGKRWIKSKYWKVHGARNWVFKDNKKLILMSDKKIIRHIPLKLNKNPYTDTQYFEERKYKLGAKKLTGIFKKLWVKQNGKCTICGLSMDTAEERSITYNNNNNPIGNKQKDKVLLAHRACTLTN